MSSTVSGSLTYGGPTRQPAYRRPRSNGHRPGGPGAATSRARDRSRALLAPHRWQLQQTLGPAVLRTQTRGLAPDHGLDVGPRLLDHILSVFGERFGREVRVGLG